MKHAQHRYSGSCCNAGIVVLKRYLPVGGTAVAAALASAVSLFHLSELSSEHAESIARSNGFVRFALALHRN